jgi:hypothetical protein
LNQSHSAQNHLLRELMEMLLRYHRYLGLSHPEYVLLQACIQYDDLFTIEDVTGFSEEEILRMLRSLEARKIIDLEAGQYIDLGKLYFLLKEVERSLLPFREILIHEYAQQNKTGQKHIGFVELVPMKKGIAVRLANGQFLSLRHTLELSKELYQYVQSAKEEELKKSNEKEADSHQKNQEM